MMHTQAELRHEMREEIRVLKAQKTNLHGLARHHKQQVKTLRAENERLREALEFIHAEADKKVLSDKKADLRSALILIDEASSAALKGEGDEQE